jgi:hypothetical protein
VYGIIVRVLACNASDQELHILNTNGFVPELKLWPLIPYYWQVQHFLVPDDEGYIGCFTFRYKDQCQFVHKQGLRE